MSIQSHPTTIASTDTETGAISIELTPKGLYHLFHLSMHEITNQMISFDEIFGLQGAQLQTMLGEMEDPHTKIALLQTALTRFLQHNKKDYVLLDHALDLMEEMHGMMKIQELEAHPGYTRRYLDVLFKEHVGISPKLLARIMRFQMVYQSQTQELSPTLRL